MEGTFHYMLMAEQAMVQKHILRTLKDTGLTMGQPKVLEYLMEYDGAEQKEIAMGCHVEAPSLTSILNRMERDGLIERRMLHGNRRSYHIFVTANKNDIAESILLPGDPLRAKFIAENFLDSPKCYNEIRGMLGYTGTYRGVPVSVQGTGMGMPSMGIYSWELITEYGVQNLIRIGTAGSFHEDIKVRDIVVGMAASTDSNYIHAFDVPGNYAPCASFKLLSELEATSKQLDIPFKAGNIVSCDVFYELKEDWWKKWATMNVLAVEMEAAALYMNAAYNRVNALAMMTISDHFVTGEKATAEERQNSFTDMMKLALETAIK